jgi:hypothetical protein
MSPPDLLDQRIAREMAALKMAEPPTAALDQVRRLQRHRTRRRLGGLSLIVVGVLGAGLWAAADSPTGQVITTPAARPGSCPERTSTEQGQKVAATYSGEAPFDAWTLRTELSTRLPGVFGGLYQDGNTLVVLSLQGGEPQTREAVDELTTASGGHPAYRIDTVSFPLARLEALNDNLGRESDRLRGRGVDMSMFGVNDLDNALVVGLVQDTPRSREAVLEAAGACPNEVAFSQQPPQSLIN